MKVKFNKDALLKHRFWILIGVATTLTLLGTFYLQLYGSDDVQKATKKMQGIAKLAKGVNPKYNKDVIEFLQQQADRALKAESKVWASAYKSQSHLLKWAPRVETEFDFLGGRFASDIKVSKFVDEKSWPEDKMDPLDPDKFVLVHGKFVEIQANWFKVKTRKEEMKIYRMANLTIADAETNKPINWDNEMPREVGKLVAVSLQTGKYFGDALLDKEQDAFAETYKSQIQEILQSVDPVNEYGGGVVQLKNWVYSDTLPDHTTAPNLKFIRFMSKERGWDVGNKFPKEAWIAQEDIWIQREIYRILRAVNDEVAVFKGKGDDEKAPKKNQAYTFKNHSFAVTLTLKNDDTLVFEIKNLLDRRQKLDLNFRVIMDPGAKTHPIFRISGHPLMPAGQQNESSEHKFPNDGKFQRLGIFGVEQLLTIETAPVKRIDQITIGSVAAGDIAQSHRTYPEELRPFDERDMPKKEKDGGGVPGGDKQVWKPGGGVGGKAGGGGGGADKIMLPHGYWTDRYLDVTEQSRRIPIAIAVIVEQDYVDRLLTHLNNSDLRFVQSQVLLNHYTGTLQGAAAEKKAGGDVPFKKGGGFGVPPGFGNPPGMGPVQGQPAAAPDVETNMEVVIYGTMTLYQRFPPRPVQKKEP